MMPVMHKTLLNSIRTPSSFCKNGWFGFSWKSTVQWGVLGCVTNGETADVTPSEREKKRERWRQGKVLLILLMAEILHHLGCMKPFKRLDIYHINWCRISSINSMTETSCEVLEGRMRLYFFLVGKMSSTVSWKYRFFSKVSEGNDCCVWWWEVLKKTPDSVVGFWDVMMSWYHWIAVCKVIHHWN